MAVNCLCDDSRAPEDSDDLTELGFILAGCVVGAQSTALRLPRPMVY